MYNDVFISICLRDEDEEMRAYAVSWIPWEIRVIVSWIFDISAKVRKVALERLIMEDIRIEEIDKD